MRGGAACVTLPARDRGSAAYTGGMARRTKSAAEANAPAPPELGVEIPPRLAERVRLARDAALNDDGEFVLYWMHNALRATENPALDAALAAGAALDKPVFVYQGLSETYRYASDRHHAFILAGARDAAAALKDRGVGYAFHLERPGHRGPHLETLAGRAALVVTEEVPVDPLTRFLPALVKHLDETNGPPVWSVDASCLVPMPLTKKRYDRAFQFKNATKKLRGAALAEPWEDIPTPHETGGDGPFVPPDLPFEPVDLETADLPALIAACAIDHSVVPVGHTPGGSVAGNERWDGYVADGLKQYAATRNGADRGGSVSRMSPYLHYGMVSPFKLARDAAAVGGKGGEKFNDELLTWRELAWHFCYHVAHRDGIDVDTTEALPDWARETLREHESDPRPDLYDWETLARGKTGTELWDLCQLSLLRQGELHNNVRMTWGKALLDWTPGQERCLDLLLDLNHRYALDGRDPSSYGGLLWCLGQFDRPFKPPQKITGTVRDRSVAGHAKRLDLEKYRSIVSRPPAGDDAPRIAVVGAGISGLACARVLQDAGFAVTVFDKGRAPGGRACGRRRDDAQFNHGAQYFTVKDDRFKTYADAWSEAGVVATWDARIAAVEGGSVEEKEVPPLLVGVPAMSALPKHLAEDLDVNSGRLVTGLSRDDDEWELRFEDGEPAGGFGAVLVTAPAPQTAALLDGHGDLSATVRKAKHRACWAALVEYPTDPNLPFDGAFLNDEGLPDGPPNPLAWAAREGSKPKRPGGPAAWTLHAKPEWSDENVDRDPADVLPELLAAFAAIVKRATGKELPAPASAAAHRWRYAYVAEPALADGEGECLYDADLNLGAAGDWCVGGRVEGAFLSGVALAGRVAGDLALAR